MRTLTKIIIIIIIIIIVCLIMYDTYTINPLNTELNPICQ